jgi:hypothetical protein
MSARLNKAVVSLLWLITPPLYAELVTPNFQTPTPISNLGWMTDRNVISGIMICTGRKAQETIECRMGKVDLYPNDLTKMSLSGWRLVQVIPDKQDDIWYYIFQR